MALQHAPQARACDVHHSSESTELFTHVAGITLPAPHDEKAVLMLKDTILTPTGTLQVVKAVAAKNEHKLGTHSKTCSPAFPRSKIRDS